MSRLTLTFDNGPWEGATDDILDLLGRRGLKATFFVVGNRLADPILRRRAERAHAEGHWIGNHTFSHRQPLGLYGDGADAVDEIRLAEEALGTLAHPDRWFRPPGKGRLGSHLLNGPAAAYLQAQRYTTVTWNNVPRDWEDTEGAWTGRALTTLATQDWSVLVVHDHHLARMPGTLERFLDEAGEAGAAFVQDYPADCTPMMRGVPAPALRDFVTRTSPAFTAASTAPAAKTD